MKVFHIISHFDLGGAERVAASIAKSNTDDMEYHIKTSEVENTVTVNAHGKTYHVPIGVFDNRVDKTSFLRGEPETWAADKVEDVTRAIRAATDNMFSHYNG